MTTEALIQAIDTYRKAERKKVEEIHQETNKLCRLVLKKWAEEHASFKVGDIISYKDGETIIEVGSISGYLYGVKPTIVYKGRVLTKRLQPRKDGWETTIYEENGREIIKHN